MNDAPQLMDEINRATWRKKANVHTFARLEGGRDPSPEVYDNVRRIESGDATSPAWWPHYLARKA